MAWGKKNENKKGDQKCKHTWKIITERVMTIDRVFLRNLQSIKGSYEPLQQTHVAIVTCTKCGDIKKFVTKHLDGV